MGVDTIESSITMADTKHVPHRVVIRVHRRPSLQENKEQLFSQDEHR
jgi:hypothetical protein